VLHAQARIDQQLCFSLTGALKNMTAGGQAGGVALQVNPTRSADATARTPSSPDTASAGAAPSGDMLVVLSKDSSAGAVDAKTPVSANGIAVTCTIGSGQRPLAAPEVRVQGASDVKSDSTSDAGHAADSAAAEPASPSKP
jgi:hypothetical protein